MPSSLKAISPTPHYFYRNEGQAGLQFMRLQLESFNLVTADKAQLFPRHQHHDYQLIFTREGCYCCVLNGRIIELRPRDLLIVKRGDWHEDVFDSRVTYLAVNFNFIASEDDRAKDILFAPGIAPDEQVMRGPNDEVWRIIEWMQTESRHRDPAVANIENALLHQLFWHIVRALPRERLSPIFPRQSAARSFGDRLRRLFEQHLSENLSNGQMASALGMSVRTLAKRSREITGRSPADAFKYYKIEYAAYALRQPEVSVKGVSLRLGFQNQYHFSRVFRRYLGHPPSRYRKLLNETRNESSSGCVG